MTYQKVEFPRRVFVVWFYTVSHRMLLLRSVRGGTERRIDAMFKGVSAIRLPMSLLGLAVSEKALGGDVRRFFIDSGLEHHVDAQVMHTSQDGLGDHEPSALDLPALDWGRRG
jgi:hypothetical protein